MTKPNLIIFSLEPIETRYTCEWHTHFPVLFEQELGDIYNVIQIDGVQNNSKTTKGAFLNFADTNYWKSSQFCKFLDLYNQGKITKNDIFLYTDFWNPTVLQLKYMKELLGYNWKIAGIVHAGSYDPYDFLGYTIKDKTWVSHAEKAYFNAIDYNFFATDFHIRMFSENLLGMLLGTKSDRPIRTGFPFEYMPEMFAKYNEQPKEDIIVFPHRKAKEKQLDIFLDLEKELPQYKFIVCADHAFTKQQYRELLGKSKLVFSANLQETLGISCYEILTAGGICLVPNRLSYTEMYKGDVLYPEEWTTNFEVYIENKDKLINSIINIMENFYSKQLQATIVENKNFLNENYFSAGKMIEVLKNGN